MGDAANGRKNPSSGVCRTTAKRLNIIAQGFSPGSVEGVQFRQCATLQYSKTPSPRSPGFEDEDENEAPHEWHPMLAEGSNQPDPR